MAQGISEKLAKKKKKRKEKKKKKRKAYALVG